jgi:hypothetical protein
VITDQLAKFIPEGAPLSLVLGAGLSVRSNIIDLLSAGVGVPPPNIIGNRTLWGSDLGIGDDRPLINTVIGTTFTTSTACTLNIQYQGAADTGAAGGYQPGPWTTFMETGFLPASQLVSQAVVGRFDFEPAVPVSFQPRFLSQNFQTLTGASFTAGTIAFSVVTMARDDWSVKYASNNFVAA